MIQVYVYDDLGDRYKLDLYKEEPIKITQSIEDVNEITQVDSNFSRQFRVPATQTNSKVFKWWYEANTVDFDITRRVTAEIHVDGILYKSGHIRILSAYKNKKTSNVDLELVFLGETKDFAAQLEDITLDRLNLTHLNHTLDINYVRNSWKESAVDPAAVEGVRYIVANRGYDYNDDGTMVAGLAEVADAQQHGNSFQKSNHPLDITQLTPMVRVTEVIKAIFNQTGYTYSDDSVFNEDWFKRLYTDGIPDESSEIEITNGRLEAFSTGSDLRTYYGTPVTTTIPFQVEVIDKANAFDVRRYFPPHSGNYDITTQVTLRLDRGFILPATATYEVAMIRSRNGLPDLTLATTGQLTTASGTTQAIVQHTLNFNGTIPQSLNQQDHVRIDVTLYDSKNRGQVVASTTTLDIATTNPLVAVNRLLRYDVKCIDFLKSILTKFKLVMAPSNSNEYEFVVKPWKDYIGSGDRIDWSNKIDLNKDVQLSPIFYEQARIIDFKDQRDEDIQNKPFQEALDRVYGQLQFDSKNTLLNQEEDEVTTIFAPTPIAPVEGFDPLTEYLIPFFAKQGDQDSDHGHLQELPMRIKPRLLFWNGFTDIAVDEDWYIIDGTSTWHETVGYPRMTPYSELPTTQDTINLNWFRDKPLFEESLVNPRVTKHKSVYEAFWNIYIQEIYSPFARKLTAYFNLDSEDLRKASFDDLIFIENAYYRIVKIYDAPLNEIATIKVDLIKILDVIEFTNNGDPTGDGGGIDPVDPTGGGGGPVDTGDVTWSGNDNNFGDNGNGSWSGFYYFTVQRCDGTPGTYTTKHSGPLSIGTAVKMSGVAHVGLCYEVIDFVSGPEETVVLEVFGNCIECGG